MKYPKGYANVIIWNMLDLSGSLYSTLQKYFNYASITNLHRFVFPCSYQEHIPIKSGYSKLVTASLNNSSINDQSLFRGILITIYLCAFLLSFSRYASAGEWEITPDLNIQITRSDNITLALQGSEKSGVVTQITPGFSLAGNDSDLKFNANYQLQIQNYSYSADSADQTTPHDLVNHLLNANANVKLVNDLLFVDGRTSITRQNVSATAPLASDNLNISNNRTNVETYSVAPYLRHKFNDAVSSELRYSLGKVSTNAAGLENTQSRQVLLNLENVSSVKSLNWGLTYNKNQIIYNGNNQTIVGSTGSQSYTGSLSYQITPRIKLEFTRGHERFDYISVGQNPEGSTVTYGFSWTPNERTKIEANAGHRYFGDTYMLNAYHRSRKTVLQFGYNEDITTTQSQFLVPATIDTATFLNNLWSATIPDDIMRQQAVDNFISTMGLPSSLAEPVNYLSNRVFLQKSIQASAGITGVRNTIMASIYGMSREAQSSATMDSALLGTSNFSQNDKAKQIGGNVIWSLRISSRTNANLSANASATGRKNYIKAIKFGLSRQLQPKINGSIDLQHTQQHSDQVNGGHQENAITASLIMKF